MAGEGPELSLYDAQTGLKVDESALPSTVSAVLLDHDLTMTLGADPEDRFASLPLHAGAVRALEAGLEEGGCFAIASTANAFRLMRAYAAGFQHRPNLAGLVLAAEAGGVYAVPATHRGAYEIYAAETGTELRGRLAARLNRMAANFRSRTGLAVFFNVDLRVNMTLENLTEDTLVTKRLADLARRILVEEEATQEFEIVEGSESVEVMKRGRRKDKIVELFRALVPGVVVSIGDGMSDVPSFAGAFGVQVPAASTTFAAVRRLPGARLLAFGPGPAGATTEQVLLALRGRMTSIDHDEFRGRLVDRIKASGFVRIGRLTSSEAPDGFGLPPTLQSKYGKRLAAGVSGSGRRRRKKARVTEKAAESPRF